MSQSIPPLPPNRSPEDVARLVKWYGRHSKTETMLDQAADHKNAIRYAEMWGVEIISWMMGNGLLEPGQNPVEALDVKIGD
jgi:hypothetical protein